MLKCTAKQQSLRIQNADIYKTKFFLIVKFPVQ